MILFVLAFLPLSCAWFDALPIKITWKLRCNQIPYRSAYISGHCFVYKAPNYNCDTVKEAASDAYSPTLIPLNSVKSEILNHLKKINTFHRVDGNSLCVLTMNFKCPVGYDMFEDYCYKPFTEKRTFHQAQGVCQNESGRLPEVSSDSINSWLMEYVYYTTKSPIWLGIHIVGSDWNYDKKVQTNSEVQAPFYFRWMFQSYGHTHAVLDDGTYAGYWKSVKPTEMHSFVCQARAY